MSRFESNEDTSADHGELVKQVLGGIDQEVTRVLARIANNIRPYFAENLELMPLNEPGSNRPQPIEARQEAMSINRLALGALYRQHRVNPARTVSRIRFASSVLDQRPTTICGVPATRYTDNGRVYVDIEQYGEMGVGFVENYVYSVRENPGGLLLRRGDEPVVLALHMATGDDSVREIGVPQKFNLSVYKIEQGGMPLQFLD